MSKTNENVETVETVEVQETKESKIKAAASKIGAGFKKHWKKVAVGTAAVAVGLICYEKKRKANQEDDDDLDIEVDLSDDFDSSDATEE